MARQTPEETVAGVVEAIMSGNMEMIADLYQTDAILVVEPGNAVVGVEAIKEAMAAFSVLKPELKADHNLSLAT